MRRAGKEHGFRRPRAGGRDAEAELGKIAGPDTSSLTRWRRAAGYFSLRSQGLINSGRVQRRLSGDAQDRYQGVGDLPVPFQIAQGFHDRRNLRINLPVEDSIRATDDRLVVVEGIPGKGDTWSKIELISVQ